MWPTCVRKHLAFLVWSFIYQFPERQIHKSRIYWNNISVLKTSIVHIIQVLSVEMLKIYGNMWNKSHYFVSSINIRKSIFLLFKNNCFKLLCNFCRLIMICLYCIIYIFFNHSFPLSHSLHSVSQYGFP